MKDYLLLKIKKSDVLRLLDSYEAMKADSKIVQIFFNELRDYYENIEMQKLQQYHRKKTSG